MARCPAHDDETPSLSIRDGEREPLVTCHAGCERSAVIVALRGRGLWPMAGDREPRARATVAGATERARRTEYVVRDADGTPVAVHVREDRPGARKRMWWSLPDGTRGLGGRRVADLPLYGVERLASAPHDATVVLVEGERAADALHRFGVLALGTVTGASATPSDDVLRVLVGRDVVVWPDHDDPGREHMTRIAARLRSLGVGVRMLSWPGAREPGDDAADYVTRGGTRDGVLALIAAAEPCDAGEHDDDGRPHLAAVPAYPVDALPEPLRALVVAGEHAGLPPEYVAAGGLVALAYCALDCRVVVTDTWVEAPAVWVPILGPASTAKSPASRYGSGPVWTAEDALRAADTAEIERWRERPAKERGPRPARTTRVVSDATIEALVRRLAEAGPQVLAIDELRSWLGALGRYGAGAAVQRDLGHYLAMWDASAPLTYDRVGGDTSVVAAEPAVAIVGTLQTEDHRLLGTVESGLRARWLPHLYRGTTPARGDGGAVPPAWTRTLTELTRARPRYRLTLSRDARTLWAAAGTRWRAEADDASPGVRTAAAKGERQALRVALVLAVGMGATTEAPAGAMQGAIAIVDYALGVWRALPEGEELVLSRTAERTSGAVDRLASWLERRPQQQATRDRILRAQVAGIRTADALDAVLAHYEAVYPGSVVEGESTSRGGRRGVVVRAPRRGNADEFPRDRGNSGACAETSGDPAAEETCGLPRDLPEGSTSPEEPEGTPPPEGTPRVRGAL